jgi:hypothetical protein
VLGIALLLFILIACCVCGYVKNPYTGKRVWVGCCCCKQVPDFESDRLALETQNAMRDGDMGGKNVKHGSEVQGSKR